MLQAPSHLSRVCGHGHIKKFWLMQIQKDYQSCESRNNLLFSSPTSCPANRGSVKGINDAPRTSTSPLIHSSTFGDATGTCSKQPTSTCAESLSPSPHSCKAGSTPSPLGSSGAETETEEISNGRLDRLDSLSMAVGGDAHISMPFPYARLSNAAAQQTSHGSSAPLVRGCCTESVSKSHLCLARESSPLSHSAQISRAVQGLTDLRPLEAARNETSEPEDRTSPAKASRDLKFFSSHVRSATPTSPDDAAQQSRNGLFIESSMQEIDHDSLSRASYMQFPVLKACSLCGTTKTPMWRSGPQGPKSLCNACGIRFKKYRSFPGQEPSEVMTSPLQSAVVPKVLPRPLKRKQNLLLPVCESPRSQKTSLTVAVPDLATGQQEKKSKWHQLVAEREGIELKDLNHGRSNSWFTQAGPPSLKKIYGCSPFQSKFKKLGPMDDHLNVNSVFAKDEEEAAVLLMHLSCGLVY